MKRAAFLDRDGVINIDHAYVHDREHFEWVPGVLEGARMLTDAGFLLVVVTNQSGIGRGYYTEADFHALTDWMCGVFAEAGAPIAAVRFCPHHPEKALGLYRRECRCRKPQPGMILDAAKDLNIDLSRSIGLPERVLLGTDGKCQPEACVDSTRTAKDLLSAVRSDWMTAFIRS